MAARSRRRVDAAVMRWIYRGMTPREAHNLTARFGAGLRGDFDWTPDQIEAVLFLYWLWETHPEARG